MAEFRLGAFQRAQRGALDDRNIVARELVERQQLPQFHLDELDQLGIVHEVDLVHIHHQRRHADLTGEQNVLPGLRHRAVGGGHHQDRAIHLRRPGDHVLHIVGMAWAVDVRVVAVRGLILHVRGGDRDAARLFLGRLVDLVVRRERRAAGLRQHLGDRGRQRRLAVIDVADRADIAMRLVPLEFRLTHRRVLRGSRCG